MYILLVDSHVQKTILKTKKQEQSDFYFKDQFANCNFFPKDQVVPRFDVTDTFCISKTPRVAVRCTCFKSIRLRLTE